MKSLLIILSLTFSSVFSSPAFAGLPILECSLGEGLESTYLLTPGLDGYKAVGQSNEYFLESTQIPGEWIAAEDAKVTLEWDGDYFTLNTYGQDSTIVRFACKVKK